MVMSPVLALLVAYRFSLPPPFIANSEVVAPHIMFKHRPCQSHQILHLMATRKSPKNAFFKAFTANRRFLTTFHGFELAVEREGVEVMER